MINKRFKFTASNGWCLHQCVNISSNYKTFLKFIDIVNVKNCASKVATILMWDK